MARRFGLTNPFYPLLVVVSIVFVITACADLRAGTGGNFAPWQHGPIRCWRFSIATEWYY